MKKMIVVSILCFASMAVFGQDRTHRERSPEEMAEKRTERLASKLELDDSQQQALREINLKYAALQKEQTEASREDRMALMKEYDAEVSEILTEDQMVRYAELKEEKKAKMKERHGKRRM